MCYSRLYIIDNILQWAQASMGFMSLFSRHLPPPHTHICSDLSPLVLQPFIESLRSKYWRSLDRNVYTFWVSDEPSIGWQCNRITEYLLIYTLSACWLNFDLQKYNCFIKNHKLTRLKGIILYLFVNILGSVPLALSRAVIGLAPCSLFSWLLRRRREVTLLSVES